MGKFISKLKQWKTKAEASYATSQQKALQREKQRLEREKIRASLAEQRARTARAEASRRKASQSTYRNIQVGLGGPIGGGIGGGPGRVMIGPGPFPSNTSPTKAPTRKKRTKRKSSSGRRVIIIR